MLIRELLLSSAHAAEKTGRLVTSGKPTPATIAGLILGQCNGDAEAALNQLATMESYLREALKEQRGKAVP